MPPEMVFATSVERNAPTRFRIAAMPTATFGFSAPVAMGVAIAFAVSWKPFVKSKNSASAMTSTTMRVRSTGVFLWIGGAIHRSVQGSWLRKRRYAVPRRYYATDSVLRHHGREVLTEHEGTAHAAACEHPRQPPARVVPHLVERHRVERRTTRGRVRRSPRARRASVRQTNTLDSWLHASRCGKW